MRVYLSTVLNSNITTDRNKAKDLLNNTHILHSYAYYSESLEDLYQYPKSIMMDSGAFTMMNAKNKKNFDIMNYCKKYAEHIKKYNFDMFMELDIEGVFGFDVYKDCLHQLQDITGKDPIYVFHKWRGLDYFNELVKQKNYIALGDVSVGNGSRELYKYFPWFINQAHKNNCKVHGLAFTSISDLQFMDFDSVDSSSWTSGARFANPYRFDGHKLRSYECKRTDNKRLVHNSIVKEHDYIEWKKLSQYFDSEYEPIW